MCAKDAGVVVASLVPAVIIIEALIGCGEEVDGHDNFCADAA